MSVSNSPRNHYEEVIRQHPLDEEAVNFLAAWHFDRQNFQVVSRAHCQSADACERCSFLMLVNYAHFSNSGETVLQRIVIDPKRRC